MKQSLITARLAAASRKRRIIRAILRARRVKLMAQLGRRVDIYA
jgi:hypothetical protein